MMYIGSHVSMSAPDYVLGAMRETLRYGANACMLYTGAPQNTRRVPMEKLKIEEAKAFMKQHGLSMEQVIVHAPYIINLANTVKEETFTLGVEFLAKELERVRQLGAKTLVLHPGAHLKMGEEAGLRRIVEGLDQAMEGMDETICIALETMAGKGSELGCRLEHIRYIIDHAKRSDRLRVCMDTCHLHDAGFDLSDVDGLLRELDDKIGLDRLACIHVNDSKNERSARKDRHANIGFGRIGFDALCRVVHHPRLASVVKILETPYVEGNPPYRYEIEMLKSGVFDPQLLEKIKEGQ